MSKQNSERPTPSTAAISNKHYEIPLWRDPLLGLTLALTLFAVAPFLQPGYHWGANDARHHVYFLFEFNRMIADGIWWPRWSPDFTFGYGYPFFNVYGPLSHFIAQGFLTLGLGYTASIEAVFVLGIVGSAAAMYGFVRSLFGRPAAVIAALVYTYAPYHLLNLYVRANLAESTAFVWLPLCLWALRGCIRAGDARYPSRRAAMGARFGWALGLAASLAALVLTSQLVTALFAPLFAAYGLVLLLTGARAETTLDLSLPPGVRTWRGLQGFARQSVRRASTALLGGLAAIGLSCIFWLPMVLERGYVNQEQWFDNRYSPFGNFVYPFQLVSPRWGFGASTQGPDDLLGFQLGAVLLLFVLAGLLLTWRTLSTQRQGLRAEVICLGAAALLATLAALTWAEPLWRADVPLLGSLLASAQFPWRWFTVPTLCLSVLAGLVAHPAAWGETPPQPSPTGGNGKTGAALIPGPSPILGEGPGMRAPVGFTGASSSALLILITIVVLSSYPYLRVQIIEPPEGPVSLAAMMQFQRTSDEMTGVTRGVAPIPTWSDIAAEYKRQAEAGEAIEPVASMVDYDEELMDYNKETGHVASSVARPTAIEEEVYYFSAVDDWAIVFNTFNYPGWTAYLLDGEGGNIVRELPIVPGEAIPDEGIPSGRITVPVPRAEFPAGGHVLLRFEDTPPRIIGRWVSLITLAVLLATALGLAVARGASGRKTQAL